VEERFYAEYAEIQHRHWWFVGRRRIIGAFLEARLDPAPTPGRRILDIGCGTGTMLGELRRFGDVYGVDAEPAAVEFCHAQGETQVELASGDTVPHPDSSFDVVSLLDVIEHVDDDQTLLAEAWRVLRPGGQLLVTVPAFEWMWGEQDVIAHHVRRYTGRQLRDSVQRAGFDVDVLSHFNTILFPPIAAIRLAKRVLPDPDHVRSDFELNKPGRLNSLLTRVFSAEAGWVARRRLPFGVSIIALARRP
jgi:SAM-dependent methyltransferase